ncbi:MAG: pitrilysin family protein [bacterium]
MKVIFVTLLVLFINFSLLGQAMNEIDIPYKQFTLKNGLTLIVHEDHKAPIVAVNVWYHVGSKNEKQGKTGFAHLFEHLMFNGSENYNDDYFKVLEKVGSSDLNGTTNNDRTNYFQTVPASAIDLVLWMESDRMGHLIGAITQAKLDEQRGVVQNEKRQGENEPYAVAEEILATNCYPKGHPYSWTVIGFMEDLAAASLQDVHEWFKQYYGAANAVLVVAGDVTAEEIRSKVERYFGDIPSGPPLSRYETSVAKMAGSKRVVAQDRVPQSRIDKVWNVPEWGNRETTYLTLLSNILSQGKTSRLYKRLVYDEQIATRVSAYCNEGEIGSQFFIEADAKPGVELAKVEQAIVEELSKLLQSGPTEKELKRIKTQYIANFISGIERIGGFGGKSDILAQSQVFGNSPQFYKTYLQQITEATANDIKNAGNKWLSDGVFNLEIHPFPSFSTVQSDVDRKTMPSTGTPPAASFPRFQKAQLSNGMKIILAERKSIPMVSLNMLLDGGFAADQFAEPGTASLTMSMLDEGTKTKDALQISDELLLLGAQLGTGANLDMNSVSLSSLKANLEPALQLMAEIILHPSFPQKELDRLKKERMVQIQQEKAAPIQMGLRVLPQYIYGKGHAYALPFSGSGYEQTVKNIAREDLSKFHSTWFKSNNATLVIVGDVSLKELQPKLEKLFAAWKPGDIPKKNIAEVKPAAKPLIYLMDRPGSQSSIIFAGHPAPPYSDKENIAIETFNSILGGSFVSRINMNLREDKHWSYGAGSVIISAKGQRPYIYYGIVQTDRTKESVQEMGKEISQFVSTKPATEDELARVKNQNALSLPGGWETNGAVLGSISNIVRFGLPDNYYDGYASHILNLDITTAHNAAKRVVLPDNLIWVVVGDRSKVESGLKEIGYEIRYVDGDGNLTSDH